jgi:hypothetical protein
LTIHVTKQPWKSIERHGTTPIFFWKESMFSLRVVDLDFEGIFLVVGKRGETLGLRDFYQIVISQN